MDGWCLAATARYSMNIGSFESCRTSSIYKLFRSSIYRNGVHSGSFPRQPTPTLYHASPLQSPQVARLESKKSRCNNSLDHGTMTCNAMHHTRKSHCRFRYASPSWHWRLDHLCNSWYWRVAIVPGLIEPLILSLKVEKPPESLLASVKSSLIWQPLPLLLLLTDTTGRLAVWKILCEFGRPFDLEFNSLSGGFDLGQFDNLPYGGFYV
jgi:hypothetical protein